jgi:hypothetical protein
VLLKNLVLGFACLCIVAIPGVAPALASPKSDLRDLARKKASEMRAYGALEQRCFMDAEYTAGYITAGDRDLKRGDRLLYVNNHDLSNTSDEDLLIILKGIAPDALIPVKVERDGQQLDLQVQCSNAADFYTVLLDAMDFAGMKKFDECVTTLRPMPEYSSQAATLRYYCARASDNAGRYDLAGYAAEVLENSIFRARYSPELRRKALQDLLHSQGVLTRASYDRLVSMTKTWPEDEALSNDSKLQQFLQSSVSRY